jgi:hypothetical protein
VSVQVENGAFGELSETSGDLSETMEFSETVELSETMEFTETIGELPGKTRELSDNCRRAVGDD